MKPNIQSAALLFSLVTQLIKVQVWFRCTSPPPPITVWASQQSWLVCYFVFQFQNLINVYMSSTQRTSTELKQNFIIAISVCLPWRKINGGLILPSFIKIYQNAIHHSKDIWKNTFSESYYIKLWHNYRTINACKALCWLYFSIWFLLTLGIKIVMLTQTTAQSIARWTCIENVLSNSFQIIHRKLYHL